VNVTPDPPSRAARTPTLVRVRQPIEGEPGSEDAVSSERDTDSVLLFVGGPLDGRVEIREARHGDPLPTVTHVHLHDGPKVVHRYDLQPLTDSAGVYHLRPRAPRDADLDRDADLGTHAD
jgi:hypothetical protein